MERACLRPPHQQLRLGRGPGETPNVVAQVEAGGEGEGEARAQVPPEGGPGRAVVTCPGLSVALDAERAGASDCVGTEGGGVGSLLLHGREGHEEGLHGADEMEGAGGGGTRSVNL